MKEGQTKSKKKSLSECVSEGLAGAHMDQAEKLRPVLPNFIIIGAPKAATTTLAAILPNHPDIFISYPKEVKFFGCHYDKGWDFYGRKFKKGKDFAFRGEASTRYASDQPLFAHTAPLLAKYIPDVKLIHLARHPFERIVSQWRHAKGRDPEFAEFEQIMENKRARRLVVGCSEYYARISKFREHFPDNQILCLTFEDFVKEPENTLNRFLSFIGADTSHQLITDGKLPQENKAGEKGRANVPVPECSPKLRKKIDDYLRDDTAKYLEYVGKPADYWDRK